jgi:hypothetical protein
VNDPPEPEENLSLAAMISALRDGEDVDRDKMAEELARRAAEMGVPWKVIAETRMRAQRRQGEDRGEKEAR